MNTISEFIIDAIAIIISVVGVIIIIRFIGKLITKIMKLLS